MIDGYFPDGLLVLRTATVNSGVLGESQPPARTGLNFEWRRRAFSRLKTSSRLEGEVVAPPRCSSGGSKALLECMPALETWTLSPREPPRHALLDEREPRSDECSSTHPPRLAPTLASTSAPETAVDSVVIEDNRLELTHALRDAQPTLPDPDPDPDDSFWEMDPDLPSLSKGFLFRWLPFILFPRLAAHWMNRFCTRKVGRGRLQSRNVSWARSQRCRAEGLTRAVAKAESVGRE